MAREAFGAPGTRAGALGTASPVPTPWWGKRGLAGERNTDFVDWGRGLDFIYPTPQLRPNKETSQRPAESL